MRQSRVQVILDLIDEALQEFEAKRPELEARISTYVPSPLGRATARAA